MGDADLLWPRLLEEKNDLFTINFIDQLNRIEDLHAEMARANESIRGGKWLGGVVELDGRPVGSCRIVGITPGEEGDLGYWLFREARGQGIITRCSTTLLDLAFSELKLQRVTLGAAPGNAQSLAVARRLGFVFSHVDEQSMFRGGEWWDTAVYVMACERWAERQARARKGPHADGGAEASV